MPDTPIVDLRHWRAARAESVVPAAPSSVPDVAAGSQLASTPSTTDDSAESGSAVIIALPVSPVDLADSLFGPAVSGAPRSVFGPVQAFGLLPRAPEPRLAAGGEESSVTRGGSGARQRQLRARHRADARGASRGPGR